MPIPIRAITISDAASWELEKNLWNDEFVPAKMTVNGVAVSVKIRHRGGHTRDYPKRSYEVVNKNQTVHYNAEFDDPSAIRNALSFAFFPMIGVPTQKAKHVLLKMNGRSLGVYLEIEAVERSFFRKRKIGASSLFYAVNNRADFGLYSPDSDRLKSSLTSGYEHRFGDSSEKVKLAAFIKGINVRNGKQAESFIRSRLDVSNYLRWLTGAVLTGNYDGFEQNYAIYRSGGTDKFRMIPWDYEGTWGRNCYGRLVDSDMVQVTGYNFLTRKMLKYSSFRNQYQSTLRTALAGPFTETRIMPLANRMLGQISPYIREDRARKWSYADFLGESGVIHNYIKERRSIVKKEMAYLS
ncbi:CotH kinase family protein [Cohnella lupini]|uniref:Spore coat protein H n=1 Tax=Cohnella lupini TaxID=1294267 RepID=A0A3D9IR80_9BACL|nr:CotH kinase family protein [Cohnella lupini]RED64158.1 spore coat protein H [Cohnella lupini]